MRDEHRSFTTLFFRFPRVAFLAILTLLVAGILSFDLLGRQEDPSLTRRYGRIVTVMPGADAHSIEALVTRPIESKLLEIAELEEISSTSRAGVSVLLLDIDEALGPDGVEEIWTEIFQKVDQAQPDLPAAAGTPEVIRAYLGAATMIIGLTPGRENGASVNILGRLAENLADDLRGIYGTEQTEIFGAVEEEISVELDGAALSVLGLSLPKIAQILNQSDVRVPAGELSSAQNKLALKLTGEFDSIDRIGDVIVRHQSDGSFVKLRDIAKIELSEITPPNQLAMLAGQRGVTVAAYLAPNQRVDSWNAQARKLVADFAQRSGERIGVDIIFEQNSYATSRLADLAKTLLFSIALIFFVLFFTMGWRSALVIGTVLPLTLAMLFLLFRWQGSPLHQMSVSGLIVALGLLIDNAIVVVDEFRLFRKRSSSDLQAINKTIKHLYMPLGASTLTTVLAFMPIVLLPGAAGEFVGMVGMSVNFAIVSSYLLSMTIIPALAAWAKVGRQDLEASRNFWRDGFSHPWLTQAYGTTIDWVLRWPILGFAFSLALPIVGFVTVFSAPSQFFPQTDRDMFSLDLSLDPSASIEATTKMAGQIREELLENQAVKEVYWFVGQGAPRVYYNVFNFQERNSAYAAGFAHTQSNQATRENIWDIQAQLRRNYSGARILALPFEQGPPVDAPIIIKIFGDNLRTLDHLSEEIRAIIMRDGKASYSFSSIKLGAPTLSIEVDEAVLGLTGQNPVGLSQDLSARNIGLDAGRVIEGVQDIPVRIRAPEDEMQKISQLRTALLSSADSNNLAGLPLEAVADFGLKPETAVITRENGRRVNLVYGFLMPYALPAPANQAVLDAVENADLQLPAGYRLGIGGEQEERSNAFANLRSVAIPLLIAMVVCIVFVFNNFKYGAVVIMSAVLSLGLAFFGIWMFAVPVGFMAILGAMGLLGLAINDTIVVLSALRVDEAAKAGDLAAARDTIIDATRHIVSTTLTTIGGFSPLLIVGDPFWLPLAAAIAGGVTGACLLALYFVPACFAAFIMLKPRHSEYSSADQAGVMRRLIRRLFFVPVHN